MTKHTKKFPVKQPRQHQRPSHAPLTAAGDKRSFDARPKPSTVERRDITSRPSQQADSAEADPLDSVESED